MLTDVLQLQIGKYRLLIFHVHLFILTALMDQEVEAEADQEIILDQQVEAEVEADLVQRVCQVWEVDLAVHLHIHIAHIQEVDQEAEADQQVEVDQVLHLVTFQAILL